VARTSHRSLSGTDRRHAIEILRSPRFAGVRPEVVYATLLDEGTYIGSVSTLHRLLRNEGAPRARKGLPRRLQMGAQVDRPDQAGVRLTVPLRLSGEPSPTSADVVLDVFSRCPQRWHLANGPEMRLRTGTPPAGDLSQATGADPETRNMEIGSWQRLLKRLGIAPGTVVTADLPDIRLLKPGLGAGLSPGAAPVLVAEDALEELTRFWIWYAHGFRHPDLAYYTPYQVYSGDWQVVWKQRSAVLAHAAEQHPERFVTAPPMAPPPPGLDPPREH
jgi:putative transposase